MAKSALPKELQIEIKRIASENFKFDEELGAFYDPSSEFAVVHTPFKVFLWNIKSTLCRTFHLENFAGYLGHIALVPNSVIKTSPTLVWINVQGCLRLWANSSFDPIEKYKTLQIPLNQNDSVGFLHVLSQNILLVGTEHGQMFKITLEHRQKGVSILCFAFKLEGFLGKLRRLWSSSTFDCVSSEGSALYFVRNGRLSCWDVMLKMDSFKWEVDLFGFCTNELIGKQFSCDSFFVWDIVCKEGKIFVLSSHSASLKAGSVFTVMTCEYNNGTLGTTACKHISVNTFDPNFSYKLSVFAKGGTGLIYGKSLFIFFSMNEQTLAEQVIPMKNINDKVLLVQTVPETAQNSLQGIVLTSLSGLMELRLNKVDLVPRPSLSTLENEISRIRSLLDTAINFSADENPIDLDYLTVNDTLAFESASVDMSKSIISSSTDMEVEACLNHKRRKLLRLQSVLSSKAVTGNFTLEAKSTLCQHAEIVHAMKMVYDLHLDTPLSFLDQACLAFKCSVDEFFSEKILKFPQLFLNILKLQCDNESSLCEVIDFVVKVLSCCFTFRDEHWNDYRLGDSYCKNTWTNESELKDALLDKFTQLRERLGRYQKNIPEYNKENLYCELFKLGLRIIYERKEIRHDKKEFDSFNSIYANELVAIKCVDVLVKASEKYKCFDNLVHLFFADNEILSMYISKFGRDFALSLFSFLIEGKTEYLVQVPIPSKWMHEFLDHEKYSGFSWKFYFKMQEYEHATRILVEKASFERNLLKKKSILSLGKLAAVAFGRAHQEFGPANRLNEKIDILSIQEKLQREVDEIDSEWKFFFKVYEAEIQDLRQGTVVKEEAMIDILCLKKHEDAMLDFGLSIELFALSEIPFERKDFLLRTIWRRIAIFDDWTLVQDSDLNGTLLFKVMEYIKNTDWLPFELILQPKNIFFLGETVDPCLVELFETENSLLQEYLPYLENGFVQVQKLLK